MPHADKVLIFKIRISRKERLQEPPTIIRDPQQISGRKLHQDYPCHLKQMHCTSYCPLSQSSQDIDETFSRQDDEGDLEASNNSDVDDSDVWKARIVGSD
ncbi:hypothetical protein FOQG_12059 [Fusarium oxysporum f. sp. raphani 54005]|uniref:Uncharacterized protein n=3 Tax=Fusarium oxysporum TaxID=5507 RepID=X0CMI2_FUSOX|nr:hypothetical protein FOQG_12059 [Fusarium oxysporum f. sp. raphani 54005]KAJ4041542.1 hypothetical protein NW763_011862 [Fusarium oxysporum]WKT49809.1 hypothetical protein QSH57_014756 [Fusarium oxysporum f. sp. vasinfectum]KAJ4084114.1 hypothetical protein NW756_008976 [Fusarium oxysporum]KAJ4107779.1 hypothetical protein NW769_008743 [Fusarium oxysporum]